MKMLSAYRYRSVLNIFHEVYLLSSVSAMLHPKQGKTTEKRY